MQDLDGRVVIVGAGQAGAQAAALLRQYGWTGPVTLLGDEPIAPYQRPPLSKAWLKGEADADSLALKAGDFYAESAIDLRLDAHALSIDRLAKTLNLANGETLAWDKLILATGARARKLDVPGHELDGVFYLRTAAHAEHLKRHLGPGRRLIVVGGGYIGLEVAASARALGAQVVVIEREARLLARVARPELSDFFQAYHEQHGVEFVLGGEVSGFEGRNGSITAVTLADGRVFGCDAALIGVGAITNDELARAAGLDCDHGVVVDLAARSSDPDIYAIGDVTRRPSALYDRMVRLESVPNALEQARQAASDLTGRPPPTHEVPWFWSDQYDLKLQIAGLAHDVDEVLVRGDPANARFAVFHLDAEARVQAVEAVNAPAEFMAGRQLIASRKPVARAKLLDMSVSMKDVAA